jgi:hypothetical protein
MNLPKMLAELRRERDLIAEAITCLERLQAVSSKPRRGRPPAWLQARKGRENKPAKPKQPPRVMTAGSSQE